MTYYNLRTQKEKAPGKYQIRRKPLFEPFSAHIMGLDCIKMRFYISMKIFQTTLIVFIGNLNIYFILFTTKFKYKYNKGKRVFQFCFFRMSIHYPISFDAFAYSSSFVTNPKLSHSASSPVSPSSDTTVLHCLHPRSMHRLSQ